ncbi:hypothetical protein [Actinoplanes teichomyceticus]|uniref:Uncharacterized protein n=1 Tax=Actinoplanes teichomyceticus TaxID=1867 RepID=A0A561WAI8_ACTTI|nr:hypothetical protein [Actinoplanes teichomyceticus]TWG20876.1 hypothetical protein FHX34_103405 [Actinoplanes teichomyceticus]GIF14538.1 hypothetical protein Ate01nite_45700 [Actinoplanes teichomyceticus]
MTDHGDRLREAFESHENQTPDPAAVYAKVVELSAKHRWRRRGATAAGGAALGAGLIAAVVNLPAILPDGPQESSAPIAAAAPATPAVTASVAPSTTPSAEPTAEWDAYFDAGYDYDDALRLARLWNMSTDDIGGVKAEAGRRLLAGQALPFPATPDEPGQVPATVQKFFAAGYGYDDAVKLAKLWHLKTPYDAKVAAGKRLLAGQTLPIKPERESAESKQELLRVEAFDRAGYDYDDAVKLAKLWHLKTPYEAKVAAGKRLLAGQSLPIEP